MTAVDDAQATREFTILNILTGHCGKQLTADLVDQITQEICREMREGATAWAFTPLGALLPK
jgi:hypothetical protein